VKNGKHRGAGVRYVNARLISLSQRSIFSRRHFAKGVILLLGFQPPHPAMQNRYYHALSGLVLQNITRQLLTRLTQGYFLFGEVSDRIYGVRAVHPLLAMKSILKNLTFQKHTANSAAPIHADLRVQARCLLTQLHQRTRVIRRARPSDKKTSRFGISRSTVSIGSRRSKDFLPISPYSLPDPLDMVRHQTRPVRAAIVYGMSIIMALLSIALHRIAQLPKSITRHTRILQYLLVSILRP